MAQTIAFFSSDARELYKADVFRALALPKGYVLQFRYQRKYIHHDLLTALDSLKGQQGQIVFVSGNSLTIPDADRQVVYHPVRQVTIRDIQPDPNIETIHFYLEMGEFTDAAHHGNTPADCLPPKAFVSRITTLDSPKQSWLSRVKAIERHFPKQLFFHITGVTKKSKPVKPVYSAETRSSHFPLQDECRYQVEVSFYDPKGGVSGLAADNSSEDAALNVPAAHRVAAERDTRTFVLHTHTLATKHQLAFTHLQEREPAATAPAAPVADPAAAAVPQPERPVFDVNLQWYVTRGIWKPWLFGVLSVVAVAGLGLAKLATEDVEKLKVESGNIWLAVVAAVCVGVPAGLLYWLFHKK